jgi:hydroxymethylglutaryl-CoA reductase
MEENQTMQDNLNQQQVQQEQQNVQDEASVSMQIQQLLAQQQQYQQQYNQLVEYVTKTPNLPIEQVNQIKVQLDQLNALFVE